MMEVASARSNDVAGLNAKRGVKRQANDSNFDDDQRFTKRFHLLSLGNLANKHSVASPVTNGPSTNDAADRSSSMYVPVPTADDHSMDVDDTKDRVYIGDLDAEAADIDAHEPEERLIFLPDIEKHFSRIPQQVLAGRRGSTDLRPEDQQLVLYGIPASLSVDQNHDSVRRAIIDARHRARDRAQELAREEEMSRQYAAPGDGQHAIETAHGYGTGYAHNSDQDSDAMDIG